MFNIFKPKEIHHYHIVEVPTGQKLPELTGDLRESIKALANHPGFVYLLARFRHQKSAMENALREGINLTETQLRYLQAGIFWSSAIEKDVASLSQTRMAPVPATDFEADDFTKVQSAIELVGQ
jgi:hypothetical protein